MIPSYCEKGRCAAGARGVWVAAVMAFSLATMAHGLPSRTMSEDTLATRQLENGIQLAHDGKMEQAVEVWRDVVSRYPDSSAAAAALDQLGSAAYPVEDFQLRGQVSGEALARARPYFERISSDYRAAPEAPRAAFKLGLMFSDPASGFYDLDEAYAHFSMITTVYPGSDLVDKGLLGLGSILASQGKCGRSLSPLSRLLFEWPSSPLVDKAWFLMGECLSRDGYFHASLRAFQSVLDNDPGSDLTPTARDRITHLVRLGEGQDGIYKRSAFIVPKLEEEWRIRAVASLAVDARNRILIADSRSDVVHVLAPGGELVGRTEVHRPSWAAAQDDLLIGVDGEVIVAGRNVTLSLPSGRGAVGDVGFAGLDPRQRLVVWDKRSGDVALYSRDFAPEKTLISGRERRVDAMAVSEDGTFYALDGKDRIVLSGKTEEGMNRETRLSILPTPDAISVDFLGNIFVLDTRERAIAAFDPSGKVLFSQVSGKNDADPFPRPVAIAVNGRGEILVYDDKRRGIVVVR